MERKRLRRAKRDLEVKRGDLENRSREERKALLEAKRRSSQVALDPVSHRDTNMAYVRNVVLNLLLASSRSPSLASRQAMGKALVMALDFSKDEECAIMQALMLS